MQFEFAAPSALDTDNRSANTARLLNMYREPAGDGAIWCKSLPGMTQFTDMARNDCRAMAEVGDEIYVVQGGYFYRVTSAGGLVLLGFVVDDVETTISSNNGNVTVVAGGIYYVWNGTTLSQPVGGAFSVFGDVTFFAQLTVLTEEGGRRVQWSGLADPTSLDALDFATTEARDDVILRTMPVGSALWFFKETSIEPWYSLGTGLAALPGATIDRGLKARNLLAQIPGGAFFVGDDNTVYLAGNNTIDRISNVAVETAITEGDPSRTLYFEDEGNKFCALIFNQRPAWVYNIITGEWCERTQGVDIGPWDAKASVKVLGIFYVGTDAGLIATLDRSNQDLGAVMVRRIVSRTVQSDGNWFTLPRVQVTSRIGFFDDEPQLAMRMSRNFGLSWQLHRQQGLGDRGEYLNRTIFRRLGQYRQATMELTLSTTSDVNISAAAFA
jgi:hypothetical protein